MKTVRIKVNKISEKQLKNNSEKNSEKTTMANHDKGCFCCRRIANDVSKYTSTVT